MSSAQPGFIRAWWQRQHYTPSWAGILVNPFYIARRGLLKSLEPILTTLRGEVLDVGCGCKPYRALVPATRYVGLDIDTPFTRAVGAADVFYRGVDFPLPDAGFDAVLCSQVLEHVFTPECFLAEIRRVLRPGGQLVMTVPLVWDEHEQPHDYGRYSSFGLRALLERCGFEIVSQGKSVTDVRAVAQIAAAWLYKVVVTRNAWVNLASQIVCIAPISFLGVVLSMVLPRNADFYLDNVVVAKKPN